MQSFSTTIIPRLILGLVIAFSSISIQAAPYFSSTAQATAKATSLGYIKTNEYSNGQAVYKANKPGSNIIKGLTYMT